MPQNRRHGPASLLRSIGIDDDIIVARGCRRVQAGPTTTPTDGRDGEAQPGRGFEKCGCVCLATEAGGCAATIWPCRGTLRRGLQQVQRPLLITFCDHGTRPRSYEPGAAPGGRPRRGRGHRARIRAPPGMPDGPTTGPLRAHVVPPRGPIEGKTARKSDGDRTTRVAIAIDDVEREE